MAVLKRFLKGGEIKAMTFDNGYPKGKLTMDPVAFACCDISNIGNKNDANYSKQVLSSMPYVVTTEPKELNASQIEVADYITTKGTKIFGYVNVGNNFPGMDEIKRSINNIAASGWYGVFIDQFGINPGETREMHNSIIDYIHENKLVCFINASHLSDAFESIKMEGFNPDGIDSHLRAGDWWLAESFLVSRDFYCGDSEFFEKYLKAIEYKKSLGIKVIACSYKRSLKNWEDSLLDIQMSYILALCLDFDGWWMQDSIVTDPDPIIDKANRDQFTYARDFPIDIGTNILKSLFKTSSNQYIAITDKYRVAFTPANYASGEPPLMSLSPVGTITDDINLALEKDTVASSVEVNDAKWDPRFAVDGLTGTRWSSLYNDSEWIYVDLGKGYYINKIILDWESARASTYKILVSDDKIHWFTITPSNVTYGNNSTDPKIPNFVYQRDIMSFEKVTGRYVKMNGLTRATSFGYSLWNFEVY